ncbi:MAG: glycogen-binding domain-containing protein [Phycisphaerae bacterium]|jgi:1,4-alpha-glucan branching enzyme
MYSNGQQKGTIKFVFKPQSEAREVSVAGNFNGWQRLPMQRQQDGTFVRVISRAPRAFEYKFVVDGNWVPDPDHSQWAISSIGTMNSLGFYAASSPAPALPKGAGR